MRSAFFLSLSVILSSPSTFAALATDASKAVSFYRSKTSAFPSGQVSRTSLENSLRRTEMEASFTVSWDRKSYSLSGDRLIRDIQVARFVETRSPVTLLSLNRSDSSLVKSVPANHPLELLECDDYWARVKEKNTNTQGWLPLHFLTTRHDDPGVYMNLIDTYVRTEPSSFGKVLTTLPRLKRVIPLEVTASFLKIQYNGKTGFVDITHFVNRADFATLAYHPKKSWLTVAFRNNNKILTKKGENVDMSEVLGYVTSPLRAIVIRPDSTNYGPPLRARVEIQKPEAVIWGISRVDGHGEVWWKKTDLLLPQNPVVEPSKQILTDTLLKREIYSIAFESKTSVRGLVSSEGIYRTDDGLTWTAIPQFGKQNYPVSIHPSGVWFVGSFKSVNQGKSFEPFIRWDKLAQAIESAYHKNPKILRLTQIEALPNSQIQISVDTGSSRVKLRSSLEGTTWNVVRN